MHDFYLEFGVYLVVGASSVGSRIEASIQEFFQGSVVLIENGPFWNAGIYPFDSWIDSGNNMQNRG